MVELVPGVGPSGSSWPCRPYPGSVRRCTHPAGGRAQPTCDPTAAVARVLWLDDGGCAHLLYLAQAVDGFDVLTRPRRRCAARQWALHPSLRWALGAITAGSAFVRNGRMDVLAVNPLGRAFCSDVYAASANQDNFARFAFLDPVSRRFYPDWDLAADVTVAILRTGAGRNPHGKDLYDLVGELFTRGDVFRARWGSDNVGDRGTGAKRFHHRAVGGLTLAYEGLEMAAEPGLTLTVYAAEPGSPSEEGLRLLVSWAATRVTGTPARETTG